MPKSTGGSAISTGMPQPLRKSRFVKLPLSCTGCAVLASLLAARPATTAISLPNTRTIKLCALATFLSLACSRWLAVLDSEGN